MAEKKYFIQLIGAHSAWKLVEIHNSGRLNYEAPILFLLAY